MIFRVNVIYKYRIIYRYKMNNELKIDMKYIMVVGDEMAVPVRGNQSQ